jgi:thiol:disulfide interchange protein
LLDIRFKTIERWTFEPMNLNDPYKTAFTQIMRVICACVLGLILIAMVPRVSLATGRLDTDNPLQTDDAQSTADGVQVRTAWSVDGARPGDQAILAIVVDIKEGYHINADAGQIRPLEDFRPYPTKVQVVAASEGLTIETARFPQAIPAKVDYADEALMSFEGRTIIYLPMKLDEQIKPGIIKLELDIEYQACTDTYCLFPQKKRIKETLSVAESGAAISKTNTELFSNLASGTMGSAVELINFNLFGWGFSFNTESGFGWILLLITAAFGGLLLNFTPCVLPLVPIKIISLSHAAKDRKRCFFLGWVMSLGVLAFWVALGILIALVSDFTATNQLFQYPVFTILVGGIIGIMAFGMFGVFSIRLPRFIYIINPRQESPRGSFALGILAAVLSTPCTAPFMGAAAAWAATQSPPTTVVTFAAIGGGMALPYLLLSAFPHLANRMPKAGPASELIKQMMGLFMLAAAAYFLGIGISALLSSPPNPPSKIYWWPVMGLVAAGGTWLAFRTLALARKKVTKTIFVSLGLILMVLPIGGAVRLSDEGPINWIYYTPERFEAAIEQRKTVVMDFTAEWCLNCKALEEGVLHDQRIINFLEQEHIVAMKVDITGSNPAGKAKLKAVGSLTVPLLVVFAPDGKPVFKSDFYTVDQVLDAVERAVNNKDVLEGS